MNKNINLNYENNRKNPKLTEVSEKGLIIGVELNMLHGKNIGVEVNIDNVMEDYKKHIERMSKDFPKDSDFLKKQLDKDTLSLTKNMALMIASSILQEFEAIVFETLTDKEPKTYKEEINIVEKTYNKYVGDSLENIVTLKLVLDILEELNAKKGKNKGNYRKKRKHKNK